MFVCFSFINHYSCSLAQGLEGYFRAPGFGQNTGRDLGNVTRDTGFDQITVRDLGNVTRDTGFDQMTVRDSGNIIGIRDFTVTRESGLAKVCPRLRD